MKNEKYGYKVETEKGIVIILALCYQINAKTQFCAFCHYSGHVDMLEVKVVAGKEDGEYTVPVSNDKKVYLSGSLQTEGELEGIIAKLVAFLKEHKRPEVSLEL